jgi:acyl dehydratase
MPRLTSTRDTRYGGYLEDYEVGDVFLHWPGKTITESEGHLFCLLTMAASPIHIDREYAARETKFGRNLVIGTYIFALLLGMSVPDISGRAIANLGVHELRHIAPVFYGDTIYAASEILGRRFSRSRSNAGILSVRTTGRNQNDQLVCRFRRSVLLPRGPAEAISGG